MAGEGDELMVWKGFHFRGHFSAAKIWGLQFFLGGWQHPSWSSSGEVTSSDGNQLRSMMGPHLALWLPEDSSSPIHLSQSWTWPIVGQQAMFVEWLNDCYECLGNNIITPHFCEHFLFTRHSVKPLMCMTLFNPLNNLWGQWCYYPHFKDEETGAPMV